MKEYHVLAVDLGASSGRVISVRKTEQKLECQEIHRFPNESILVGERRYTDILYLFGEILQGMKKAIQQGICFQSIGIDSWGVDIGLLDKNGELLGNPYHYRDGQAEGMQQKAEEIFGPRGLFFETGVQDMWYNTVYQMMGMMKRGSRSLEEAETVLTLADLLSYFLTGNKSIEYTLAATTQMYSLKNRKWSDKVFYELGLQEELFAPVMMTGESKGEVLDSIKERIGMDLEEKCQVIATASHDSAAAAYAVPSEKRRYLFINSGTWSILGMVLDEPVIREEIYDNGYSNEGAAFGKIKLVRSVMGMWLIQELRRCWERKGMDISYEHILTEASAAESFGAILDVDDSLFIAPENMEKAIQTYCRKTGQQEIKGQGELYRCVMESLALKYREAVDDMEQLIGEEIKEVFLLGGAVQDQEFCQYIADATGRCVCAGPTEATAVGNALVQLNALGAMKDDSENTRLIRSSFEIRYYEPMHKKEWEQPYDTYKKLVQQKEKDRRR